jgi:hypothetical protein
VRSALHNRKQRKREFSFGDVDLSLAKHQSRLYRIRANVGPCADGIDANEQAKMIYATLLRREKRI